ncbi:contactin-associated protein 1-like [Styela clava]
MIHRFIPCPKRLSEGAKPHTVGMKGVKGETGPEVNVTKLQTKIMKMLGAKGCEELKEVHGLTEPGYYLIRSEGSNLPSYVYCDFRVYEGNVSTTCHELRQRNTTITSGFYTLISLIDLTTFKVYCDFSSGKAITEIRHAEMEEIKSTQNICGDMGCYSWIPRYNLNREQIIGIIEQSRECRQFIKARCVQTLFLYWGYAWGVSRDGERMRYWGGSTSRRDDYCACGETGTCINNKYKCNCDAGSGTQGTDEGYLTDKTKLPVKELRFGDLNQSNEFVWHTLGKLECWGEA